MIFGQHRNFGWKGDEITELSVVVDLGALEFPRESVTLSVGRVDIIY